VSDDGLELSPRPRRQSERGLGVWLTSAPTHLTQLGLEGGCCVELLLLPITVGLLSHGRLVSAMPSALRPAVREPGTRPWAWARSVYGARAS